MVDDVLSVSTANSAIISNRNGWDVLFELFIRIFLSSEILRDTQRQRFDFAGKTNVGSMGDF